MHKTLEEMAQELVRKSGLLDHEINALVQVDDVTKINVASVLKRAEILAAFRELPIGEMKRAEILVRSLRAAKRIIQPSAVSDSEESRVERHHEKMSNGLNSVAHLDTDALNRINEKQ